MSNNEIYKIYIPLGVNQFCTKKSRAKRIIDNLLSQVGVLKKDRNYDNRIKKVYLSDLTTKERERVIYN